MWLNKEAEAMTLLLEHGLIPSYLERLSVLDRLLHTYLLPDEDWTIFLA